MNFKADKYGFEPTKKAELLLDEMAIEPGNLRLLWRYDAKKKENLCNFWGSIYSIFTVEAEEITEADLNALLEKYFTVWKVATGDIRDRGIAEVFPLSASPGEPDRIEKVILADEDGDIIRPIDSFAIVHPCYGCKKDFPVPQTEPDEDDIELEEEKNPCYHCTRLCKSWGEALHHICNNWNRDGRRKVYAIVDGEAHLVSEA